jgi:carboxypeptidase Taq
MAASPYQQLEEEFRRLHALRGATALLRWDAAVMMPRGSADARGEQLAALDTECHAILSSPKVSRLIDRAQANAQMLDDWQLANLREMRRQRDYAIATPATLVARLAKATARAEAAWIEARRNVRFADLAPHLEEVVHLVREKSALLGSHLALPAYDALVNEFSPGIVTAEIDGLNKALARRLPGLVREVIELQGASEPLPLTGKFSAARQKALAVEVMKAVGFSFERGRLDECEHSFTEGWSEDLRVTAHFAPGDPFQGLLSALHECGHAVYHLGLPAEWRTQPVGRSRGMALEESQSLLFEMILARSRPFVNYLKPLLERHLQVQGPEWDAPNLHRVLTRVRRVAQRVDADELTYPSHIMLRYELEKQILAGELKVAELPEAWNAAAQTRLGLKPANDAEGCLQDGHWPAGYFGYFPAYGVGFLAAMQLWEQMRGEREGLDAEIAAGDFKGLLGWLREQVHSQGARLDVQDLVKQASGKPLSAAPALRYLEAKYLEAR